MQREKTKYKDLLANAQIDLSTTKTLFEKETEFKTKQESSYHLMAEENTRLIAS